MGVLEETTLEDIRFREELKKQTQECEPGRMDEVLRLLSEESKQKHRKIMEKYNPQISTVNS